MKELPWSLRLMLSRRGGRGGESSFPLYEIADEMRRVFSLLQVFLRWQIVLPVHFKVIILKSYFDKCSGRCIITLSALCPLRTSINTLSLSKDVHAQTPRSALLSGWLSRYQPHTGTALRTWNSHLLGSSSDLPVCEISLSPEPWLNCLSTGCLFSSAPARLGSSLHCVFTHQILSMNCFWTTHRSALPQGRERMVQAVWSCDPCQEGDAGSWPGEIAMYFLQC